MPSGAALLGALVPLIGVGFCDGALASVGLERRSCLLWAGVAIWASMLNLNVGRGLLLNPGGTLVPLAFAAFLWTRPWRDEPRTRSGGLVPLGLATLGAGIVLAGLGAWAEQSGVGWPAVLGAALGACVAVHGATRRPRDVLAATAAAMALCALLRYAAGAATLGPWPASLGGGATFTAGVVAMIGAQVAWRIALGLRRRPASLAGRQAKAAP